MRPLLRLFLVLTSCILLTACFEEEKEAVSYVAYNHTDKSIVSIIINGEGGILNARAQSGGGEMCCIILPSRWRPGLKAAIKWREAGKFQRDAKGKVMADDGVPIVIEAPWKESTVEVPKYEEMGRFYIHFLPKDEIKVAVSLYDPGRVEHPYHFEKYRSEYEKRRSGN